MEQGLGIAVHIPKVGDRVSALKDRVLRVEDRGSGIEE